MRIGLKRAVTCLKTKSSLIYNSSQKHLTIMQIAHICGVICMFFYITTVSSEIDLVRTYIREYILALEGIFVRF